MLHVNEGERRLIISPDEDTATAIYIPAITILKNDNDDADTDNQEKNSDLVGGYGSSELALYKNALSAEIPDNWTEALEHLDKCEHLIVDQLS